MVLLAILMRKLTDEKAMLMQDASVLSNSRECVSRKRPTGRAASTCQRPPSIVPINAMYLPCHPLMTVLVLVALTARTLDVQLAGMLRGGEQPVRDGQREKQEEGETTRKPGWAPARKSHRDHGRVPMIGSINRKATMSSSWTQGKRLQTPGGLSESTGSTVSV